MYCVNVHHYIHSFVHPTWKIFHQAIFSETFAILARYEKPKLGVNFALLACFVLGGNKRMREKTSAEMSGGTKISKKE